VQVHKKKGNFKKDPPKKHRATPKMPHLDGVGNALNGTGRGPKEEKLKLKGGGAEVKYGVTGGGKKPSWGPH